MTDYKTIDMESYERKAHFEYFSSMPDPTVGLTVKVDVTKLVSFCKMKKCSFYMAMTHIACIAANKVPELRRRTKDGGIIEYTECGSSHIEPRSDGSYCYCTLWHNMNWDEFIPYAEKCRERAKQGGIEEDEAVDALYFVTTVPWLHYEQVSMPVPCPINDNPSFCWGKWEADYTGRKMMPFSLFVNHALMDGIHIAEFYRILQEELDRLEMSDTI